MSNETENQIIVEYKNGNSSLKIAKLLNLSKPTILRVLRKHNLIRKRDRCSNLEIRKEGDYYLTDRICPKCGEIITTKSKDKLICCRNHFNKVNAGSICKPCSLEMQIGEGNPFYGKKHTEEVIKKISKSRTGKACGSDNSMANPKWKEKAAENLKKRWESGELEHTRKIMSEHMKKSRRLGKLKSVNVSKKEIKLVKQIKELGVGVVHSYRIDTKICDIYIPDMNLIIEYFGDYWHCNPNKYKADYFHQKKGITAEQIWYNDRMKVDLIIEYGYNLEVVWESDLKHDNQKILEILKKYDTKNKYAPGRSSKDSDTRCPI
jgi:G:T-mismatch repair DNA endonuclease (very short patch repair protein)/ribosomal protein S27AE